MYFYLNETARLNGVTPLATPASGDAGYDIRSNEHLVIVPGEQALVSTGLHVEIPAGYVGIIKDRSSVARAGIRTAAGVIDASFRGEVRVLLENRGTAPFIINLNDRIVQMLVLPVYTEVVQQVNTLDALSSTGRGVGGFGSTGRG
jgi:dUTP pyrophosphatase